MGMFVAILKSLCNVHYLIHVATCTYLQAMHPSNKATRPSSNSNRTPEGTDTLIIVFSSPAVVAITVGTVSLEASLGTVRVQNAIIMQCTARR